MWFAVLPDGEAGLAAVGMLRSRTTQVVEHASGRPWLIGQWPDDQLHLVRAGSTQAAVIGRCPITAHLAARLARMRHIEQIEQVAAGLPGSFHLAASAGGRTRVRGSASAVRRVFHARLAGATVAASRSDVLARAIGAPVDERVLAARLLPGGVVHPLEDACVWRGVSAVPADYGLSLEPDGRAFIRRWWRVPYPVLPLGEGALVVREALVAAVDSCTRDGGVLSADLSGGLGSTSLCHLAARGPARLVTIHCGGMDPGGDDGLWARRAAAGLPNATHLTVSRDELPLWFAGLGERPAALEEPSGWVRDAARLADLAGRMTTAGSRLHLMGGGGNELFSPLPCYLHDLIRRRPLTALMHLRQRRARWRQPWWTVLRALAEHTTHSAWLAARAGDLGTRPAPADPYSMAWGPALRMPTWATPAAVHAAREVLAGIAAADPPPLAPQRAQHTALLHARTSGNGIRRIDQATSRLGLTYTAPFLDDAVIEAALSVRPHERMALAPYKPLLTAAMDGIVPAPILNRRTKDEYGAGFHAGLGRHRVELLELFADSELARLGLIDTGVLRSALVGPHPQPDVMGPLSQTLACEIWLRSLTTTATGDPR